PRSKPAETAISSGCTIGRSQTAEGSMRADYVIIGAGSAGCVLANRLTEDPVVKVLLIEAGGRDWNPYIHVPAGFMKMLDHPTLTWGYHAEPDPGHRRTRVPLSARPGARQP